MALKDIWEDKVDGVSDVLAEDINNIARSVIDLENSNGDIVEALNIIISEQEAIISLQNALIGGVTE